MENERDGRRRCDRCGKMVDTVWIVGWGFAPPYIHAVCTDCYDELREKHQQEIMKHDQ